MEERLKKLEESMHNEKLELQEAAKEKERRLKHSVQHLTHLRQIFECLVCKSAAKLPAIVLPCRRIVFGCATCIEQWLSTSTQYPHCRGSPSMDECSKLPFIRSLENALHESSGTDSSASEPIEVD